MTIGQLATALFDAGAVKIDFAKGWTLKSGIWSPVYVNLRILQSHPTLLADIARMMADKLAAERAKYDLVAGIPLAAVPLGVALSLTTGIPHVTPRMENKDHGLRNRIDGVYAAGQSVLLVDDLITKATSKLEAIAELEGAGLLVRHVVVVLDREQGGTGELSAKGYTVHSLTTLKAILTALVDAGRVTPDIASKLTAYLDGATMQPEGAV